LGTADFSFVFGDPGDKPFAGDLDGDGAAEVALHRESTGLVYYRTTLTTGVADASFIFGDPGDRMTASDWNANGSDSVGLFRPGDATFYLRNSNTQGNADIAFPFGANSWVPVSGSFGIG
jgi:hypothetical protein